MIATPKISNEKNIREIRGWIIDCLNGIEMFIDVLIVSHFEPQNREDFERIVLNASIIGTAAKLKILSNFAYVPNSIIEKIRKLTAIRNGFAHAHSKNVLKISHDPAKEQSPQVSSFKGIEVMNSNGRVEIKDFIDYYSEFSKIFEETKIELTDLFKERGLKL